MHARMSGQEFWTDDAPALDIIQENASVFTEPGEVVIGPLNHSAPKHQNAWAFITAKAKGWTAAIFLQKVMDEDMAALKEPGEKIWKQGEQELVFEPF